MNYRPSLFYYSLDYAYLVRVMVHIGYVRRITVLVSVKRYVLCVIAIVKHVKRYVLRDSNNVYKEKDYASKQISTVCDSNSAN